jgi:selenide,water dikinase
VLSAIYVPDDPRVLVDFRTGDDAGVFRWEGGPALVQTVDFFTPIVDDPYLYGQIAAANAVSDVYAMGGTPLTALAIAALPKEGPGLEAVQQIFKGGQDKLREAGVALLGGHTVQDQEIKFGYAVTGAIDPARILSNAGARPGDVLILTKPLGTGIIATAAKFERASRPVIEAAERSMCELNRAAAEALASLPPGAVHACTDVTGFGLVGHAMEMATASRCTLRIETAAVPLLEGAVSLAQKNTPGGGRSNREFFSARVDADAVIEAALEGVLYDPQTSGGLLAAVDAAHAEAALEALRARGVRAKRVGQAEPAGSAAVVLKP